MNVLDLFCGAAGGWSLGLHRAGFTTVAACEIDPQRRAAFGHNNPGVRLYSDVRELTADRLLADLGYLPNVIAGSPPCQDASTANPSGKGIDGERTGLFKDYVRLVGEVRPRWCAAENVPGLRTRGADWVLDALEAIGYTCWPDVVGAVHAGAPHERKRAWFIAADTDQVGSRPRKRRGGRQGGPSLKAYLRTILTPTESQNLTCPSMEKWPGNWGFLLATPTKRDWRSGKASDATFERNSRPLNEQLVRLGLDGTEAQLATSEWLMGYPPGWLATALQCTAMPSSPSSPSASATRSDVSKTTSQVAPHETFT